VWYEPETGEKKRVFVFGPYDSLAASGAAFVIEEGVNAFRKRRGLPPVKVTLEPG